MTLYLYSLARYRQNEDGSRDFVEYALPFSAYNDETAGLMVADSLNSLGLKDKINLSLFKVFKVGEFNPDDCIRPITSYYGGSIECIIDDFSVFLQKVEVPKDEQE